jgi:putative DNA primase/helicase
MLLNKFDMNRHLFSFENGITYNLRTKECRTIVKTDYILTTCGYDYPERINEDVVVAQDFFLKLFKEDQLDYSLSCLATFLYGENINEMFLIMKGLGRNGKGLTDTALQTVLGKYHQTLPSEELTEDSKGKGRANSALANARFVRCLMTSEPDNKQKMKTDRIKLLTGRDPITARQLYGKEFVYQPQFTLCVQCNDVPEYSKIDDAIAKRVAYLEFPFQFVNKVEREYQRPIDESLKDKVRQDVRYRNGILHLLFDTWFFTQGKVTRTVEAEELAQEEFDNNNPLTKFLVNYEPSIEGILSSKLNKEYNNHYEPLSITSFNKFIRLTKLKFTESKSHGLKVFIQEKK